MSDRLIRDRIEDARVGLDRAGPAGRRSGAPVRAGRVVDDGAIPTAVPKFFAVAPIASVSGAEVEGGSGGTTSGPNSARDYVYVLGPDVPAAGDTLVYWGVGDRWAAEFGATTDHLCDPCHLPGRSFAGTFTRTGQSPVALTMTPGARNGVSGSTLFSSYALSQCFTPLGTPFTRSNVILFCQDGIGAHGQLRASQVLYDGACDNATVFSYDGSGVLHVGGAGVLMSTIVAGYSCSPFHVTFDNALAPGATMATFTA